MARTLAVVALVTLALGCGPGAAPGEARDDDAGAQDPAERTVCVDPPRPSRLQDGRVVEVTDGDTVRVRLAGGRVERVRMIGVDAPEEQPSAKLSRDAARSGRSREAIQTLGRRASAFTRHHLADQPVALGLDVQERDRHGRLLAYLWVGEGVLFNRLLLAEGFAQVLTVPPNVRYAALFRHCEREARALRRGLWAE